MESQDFSLDYLFIPKKGKRLRVGQISKWYKYLNNERYACDTSQDLMVNL